MSVPSRFRLALLLPLMTASCALYLGGDDDFSDDYERDDEGDDDREDDDCGGEFGEPTGQDTDLRNPETGLCETFSSTGGGPCDQCGGNCSGAAAVTLPTWGLCESPCSSLQEMSCVSTDGCRPIYMDWCPGAGCPDLQVFTDCWPTDQSGPLELSPDEPPFNQHCIGLDAQSCSTYSDCSAVHQNSCGQATELPGDTDGACVEADFERCEPEKVWCYEGDSCGEGYVCNAETLCEAPATCDEPGLIACPCAGYCVPEDDPA